MTAQAPRPAKSFTTARAQKWVLMSAMLTALIYGVRRITGDTAPTGAGGKLGRLAGAGQPATLAHWAVSYGIAYTMLAILAVGAPEAAASLAMLALLANLLANGTGIVRDLQNLESGSGAPPAQAAAKPAPARRSAPALPTSLTTGNNPRGTAVS